MKKFYYLFICIPFLTLFFSISANAATSSQTVNSTDSDGNILNIRYQNHTLVPPIDMNQISGNNYNTYDFIWEFTENVDVILTQGKYYTGYVTIGFVPTPSLSGLERIGVEITNSNTTQGIYTYITSDGGSRFNLNFVFDNYYTASETVLGAATVKLTYAYMGSPPTNLNCNLTPTITISKSLRGYDVVQNNALTGMIYTAIYQGVGPDLETIIGLLNTIKNTDYTYYTQLVNSLSNVSTQLEDMYDQIQEFLEDTNNNFYYIETILDLFPSYRTQVLAYWQQLLEMNAEQESKAAEIESQAQNKENQSNDLLAGLDSIQLPSISAGDLDIFSGTDNTVKTNFFGLIGIITHQSLITKLFLIVVIAGITGYAIYGKRG